jgi:ATP-dependent RNA helicase DHX57
VKNADKIVDFLCQPQDSALMADEQAALMALFNVSAELPHDRTLPEPFKSQWMQLVEEKKNSEKPFVGRKGKPEQRKKEEVNVQDEKKEPEDVPPKVSGSIEMDTEVRKKIEKCLSAGMKSMDHIVLSQNSQRIASHSDSEDLDLIKNRLLKIGFSEDQIQTVLNAFSSDDISVSLNSCIEWLILNLDEEELPIHFRNEKWLSRVEFSGKSKDSSQAELDENDLLLQQGFPFHLSEFVSESESQDDIFERLYSELYNHLNVTQPSDSNLCELKQTENEEMNEEFLVLESMYDSNFIRSVEENSWSIIFEFSAEFRPLKVTFKPFRFLKSYPNQFPIIFIQNFGDSKRKVLQSNEIFLLLCSSVSSIANRYEEGSPITHEILLSIDESFSNLPALSLSGASFPPEWTVSDVSAGKAEENASSNKKVLKKKVRNRPQKVLVNSESENLNLLEIYQRIQENPTKLFIERTKQRESLPIFAYKDEIISEIEHNQVVILAAETGSGKSTQTGQYILEHYLRNTKASNCMIACAQPRRISATSIAERVASEFGDKLGNLIGYKIRMDSKFSSNTRLCYMTTGLLLRYSLDDPLFSQFSHIIIDEVHERSCDVDLLLALLKFVMISGKRSDLRITLMSATLDSAAYINYFGMGRVLKIPGRTFPVNSLYLDDILNLHDTVFDYKPPSRMYRPKEKQIELKEENKLLQRLNEIDENNIDPSLYVSVIWHIYFEYVQSKNMNGSILIFLPGMSDILIMMESFRSSIADRKLSEKDFWILPLHSSLSASEQRKVFQIPPLGIQKIIFSTNIAEASITIEDVVYVIDSGKMNQSEFDTSRSMSILVDSWISKSNSTQRQGRAGRVRSGYCFKMFTSKRFKKFLEEPVPEIQRTSLDGMYLQIEFMMMNSNFFSKNWKNAESFLLSLMNPPSMDKIKASHQFLESIGAIYFNIDGSKLTSLGAILARLPNTDVRISKLLVFGALMRCLTPALIIAVFLTEQPPFISPFDKREESTLSKRNFRCGFSDHLSLVRVFDLWYRSYIESNQNERRFCEEVKLKTL